jgi:hypothetical protein
MSYISTLYNYLFASKRANPNDLTLEYWEIHICESIRDAMNGNFTKITEIYIPELELSINQKLKPLNIFISKRDRYVKNKSNMSGETPTLIKTKIVSGKQAEALKWLALTKKEEKQKQEQLTTLFDEIKNNHNSDDE